MSTNAADIPPFIVAAAQSPDPTMRALAARRTEIAVEAKRIDSLFSTMETLTKGELGSSLAKLEASISAGTLPKPQFVEAVRNILVASGQPLQPTALFTRFQALYPAFALGGPDALRKRMHGMKEHFVTIRGAGYWPADLPPPVETCE